MSKGDMPPEAASCITRRRSLVFCRSPCGPGLRPAPALTPPCLFMVASSVENLIVYYQDNQDTSRRRRRFRHPARFDHRIQFHAVDKHGPAGFGRLVLLQLAAIQLLADGLLAQSAVGRGLGDREESFDGRERCHHRASLLGDIPGYPRVFSPFARTALRGHRRQSNAWSECPHGGTPQAWSNPQGIAGSPRRRHRVELRSLGVGAMATEIAACLGFLPESAETALR